MNQIKYGAMLSYVIIFVSMLIALIYTPFVIRLLGQEEFGLYSLIGSIAAYFSIMDLGLGNTIVRFISRNREIGDSQNEAKLNGTFLILYSMIGLLTVIIGIIIYFNLEQILGSSLTISELYKAKIMIVVLIINFSFSFPLSVFNSLLRAYERFIFDKIITLIRIISIPIVTLPILFLGFGAISMVVINTIINILCLVYCCIYTLKKLKIKIKIGKIEKKVLIGIFSYSFFIFLNVVVDQIFWKTDQVILGIVTGTISVAIFAVAMQFITLYMQFSTAISNLLLPKLSRMSAQNANNTEFSNVMIKYGRIQFIIIALILSGFTIFGEYFINIWAGNGYIEAYYIVIIIMVPLTIPLIQNTGITILQAKNKLAFRSILYIITALINVVVSIPLAIKYDGIGTAIVTSASLIVAHIIIMNFYYHKAIKLNIVKFWRNIITILIPVIFSTIFGSIIVKYFIPLNNILNFTIGIILFFVIYVFSLWKFAMNKTEKELVMNIYRRTKKLIFNN